MSKKATSLGHRRGPRLSLLDQVEGLPPAPVLTRKLLAFIEQSDQAHTAEELTAQLLNVPGIYAAILSADVAEQSPVVRRVLADLVAAGKVAGRVITLPPVGPRMYYRRID